MAEEPEPIADEGAILADEPSPSLDEMPPATDDLTPILEPEPAPEPVLDEEPETSGNWPMETTPETPMESPATEPEPEPEYPAEVRPFIHVDGRQTYLNEKDFPRATKTSMESMATSSPRSALSEKKWHPHKRVAIADIHKAVDRLRPVKVKPAGDWLKTKFTKAPAGPTTRREVVPANILSKRIVYETEGGFVVEVTYRHLSETRKKFFTVSSLKGRTEALASIQSGKYADATIVGDHTIAGLGRPKKAKLPFPPGKVDTFVITNKWDVAEIEGIGDIYGRRLHELGIHTTDQLRLINATVIANNVGAQAATVQQWQQMSELLCVKGIGKQYAEILVKSGVKGVDELKRQKPKVLSEKINKVNEAHKPRIMGSKVQPRRAWGWILAARHLKKELQDFPQVEA